MRSFTSPVSPGAERGCGVKFLFLKIRTNLPISINESFNSTHHTGGISFMWKKFTSPMGSHHTGDFAFVMQTRNENTKDSMGRWNLACQPLAWQVRWFSSCKQDHRDTVIEN